MADTAEVMKAIEVVKRHLDEDWISEGCNEAVLWRKRHRLSRDHRAEERGR